MMANFLGVEVFNKGIEEYLKKHKYGNAEQVNITLQSKFIFTMSIHLNTVEIQTEFGIK